MILDIESAESLCECWIGKPQLSSELTCTFFIAVTLSSVVPAIPRHLLDCALD